MTEVKLKRRTEIEKDLYFIQKITDLQNKLMEKEMTENEIALKKWEEYLEYERNHSDLVDLLSFNGWLKEQDKPDPLFDKWKKLGNWWRLNWDKGNSWNGAFYTEFKEIFKEELNDTKLIDEAIEMFEGDYTVNTTYVVEKLKEIKQRLNNV